MPCHVCTDVYKKLPCEVKSDFGDIDYTKFGKKIESVFLTNLFKSLHKYTCPCKRCIVTINCSERCKEYNLLIQHAKEF